MDSRRSAQSTVYSVRIASGLSEVLQIVCGSQLRLLRAPLGWRCRANNFLQHFRVTFCNPYTIYSTLEQVSKILRIVYGSRPTPPKCCI